MRGSQGRSQNGKRGTVRGSQGRSQNGNGKRGQWGASYE